MNYYEEVLHRIDCLFNEKKYEEAKKIITDELNVSYVPRDYEKKLQNCLKQIDNDTYKSLALSDEQIGEYLFLDQAHQLLAIDQLDRTNLRDYLPLCKKYLESEGYINGKVLLIDSLIKQEINADFLVKKNNEYYKFNPSRLLIVEQSIGYQEAIKLLNDYFMKNPSMLLMAKQLLYKQAMLNLPHNMNKNEGIKAAEDIEKYIVNAFESAN